MNTYNNKKFESKDISTKLNWNNVPIKNIYFNHNKYPNVYWNGEKVIKPLPISGGDYVWYIMNPKVGFKVENGENKVIDQGSTFQYFGDIYSGRFTNLDQNILKVPINFDGTLVYSSIIYYDLNQKRFIQLKSDSLPLQNYYEFTNINISSVVVLWNRFFSDLEMDKLNNNPVTLVNWAWNKENDLSYSRLPDDKVYFMSEMRNYAKDNIEIWDTNSIFDSVNASSGSNLIIVDNGDGSWNISGGGQAPENGENFQWQITTNEYNPKPHEIIFDLEIISGDLESCKIISNFVGNDHTAAVKLKNPIKFEEGLNNIFLSSRSNEAQIYVYIDNIRPFEIKISNIKVLPLLSDYIFAEGNNSLNFINDSLYGIPSIRSLEYKSGIYSDIINGNLVNFKGTNEYIATGMLINPTQTNISIMIAFTIPNSGEEFQDLVIGGSNITRENAFHLEANSITGQINVKFGNSYFDITPYLNPDFFIHGVCMTYNTATGEIYGAADGQDLQSFGNIIFSQQIDQNISIGSNYGEKPYRGFIGEGILSTNIISNNEWLEFWERVKDQNPIKIPSIIDCDEYYSCESYWKCGEPNYLNCSEELPCDEEISCYI
jgi:hypothetical protein